jgi:hypothetical protein
MGTVDCSAVKYKAEVTLLSVGATTNLQSYLIDIVHIKITSALYLTAEQSTVPMIRATF